MPFGGIYHRTGSTAVRKGEINVKEKKNLHRRMERWEFVSLGLLLYDALAVNAAYFLALWLRYDMRYSAGSVLSWHPVSLHSVSSLPRSCMDRVGMAMRIWSTP